VNRPGRSVPTGAPGDATPEAGQDEVVDARLDAALSWMDATAPGLPADRFASRKEHLMNQLTHLNDEAAASAAPTGPSATTAGTDPVGTGRTSSAGRRSVSARWAALTRRRRLWVAAGVTMAATGGLLGGPAIAEGIAYRFANGMHQVDVEALEVEYNGKLYTWDQIADLQKQGKATVTTMDPGSAKQGKAHAFDTPEQERAWACVNIPGLADAPDCAATSRSTP
jgi:hypothetical protein